MTTAIFILVLGVVGLLIALTRRSSVPVLPPEPLGQPARRIASAAPQPLPAPRSPMPSPVLPFTPSAPAHAFAAPTAPPPKLVDVPAFFGLGQHVQVAGRTLADPLAYIGATAYRADAGTIVTTLPVGNGSAAAPLDYWPSYIDASPAQRGRFLDWMASGRRAVDVPIGYVFIFFNGIERRTLVDCQDQHACMAEVARLVESFGGESRSFAGYGQRLLTFLLLRDGASADEAYVDAGIGTLAEKESTALAATLAWYHDRRLPLPSRYAILAASAAEDAKRSVVLERAATEFRELFATRYTERFDAGLTLVAAKRPLAVEYQPASASLSHAGFRPRIEISNVFGRSTQFRPLVEIWNGCIDDLRKLSSKRAQQPGALTSEMWESLPEELRRETDHPDADRWIETISKAPRAGNIHLLHAHALGALMGWPATEKLTAAQAKRVAERAELLGFALEPDARLLSKPWAADAPVAVWRPTHGGLPDAGLYAASRNLLTLLLTIVMADDDVDDRELDTVSALVEDAFVLDEAMRLRLGALREILLRLPPSATGIAKKLRESRSKDELASVGRMLVTVAAADGVLADGEHKALRSMFKALGLSPDDLDGALVRANLRVQQDEVVEMRASHESPGEQLPRRPAVDLDPVRIAALHQETAEVSRMLGEILDSDDDENDVERAAAVAPPLPESADQRWAGLELRYHAAAGEIVTKPMWSATEARGLARRHHLMPAGIVEAVNAWAEDVHGDSLIEESDGWRIMQSTVERIHA